MKKTLLPLILVLAMTPLAGAIAVVHLSLDGVNPAPDNVDVLAGQLFEMYVISDRDAEGYWRDLFAQKSDPVTISNVQKYPAAGNLATVIDYSDAVEYCFYLRAKDSAANILAGKHFSFDVTIAPDTIPGTTAYVNTADFGAGHRVLLNVVPEPCTLLLLTLGGLALSRRRR